MTRQTEALRLLRRIGTMPDNKINVGETALALATLERPDAPVEIYRAHLDDMVGQLRAEGPVSRLEDQLRLLRQVLVIQNKYQGQPETDNEQTSSNLFDVIDHRSGSALALSVIYLHIADALGWAMTGIDLAGHFLLRISARDGQAAIDPFRAGQTCQIVQASDDFLEEAFDEDELAADLWTNDTFLDLSSDLLHALSRRELLLKLQHNVKRSHLAHDRMDAAIKTLQAMVLFAPTQQDVWRELSHLQAERGHIRAAISALEAAGDLDVEMTPMQKTGDMLRELRWRLN